MADMLPQGFETGLEMWMGFGRRVFAEKWGHDDCKIVGGSVYRTPDMAWNVEPDW